MKTKINCQGETHKQWSYKNKEYSNYLKNRSIVGSFIRKKSTLEDLGELEELIEKRRGISKSDQLD